MAECPCHLLCPAPISCLAEAVRECVVFTERAATVQIQVCPARLSGGGARAPALGVCGMGVRGGGEGWEGSRVWRAEVPSRAEDPF